MENLNWMSIVYMLGVLLLIAPMIAYAFKAPYALRNATVWLAIMAALGWAYKLSNGQFDQFINMPYQNATDAPAAENNERPSSQSEIVEDSPIRNP